MGSRPGAAVSLAVQLEAFRALVRANQEILARLAQGSAPQALEALFQARQDLLQRISSHPLAAGAGAKDAAQARQDLAQAQIEAARTETQIAEALAQLVPSIEKIGRYRAAQEEQKKPRTRWDSRG